MSRIILHVPGSSGLRTQFSDLRSVELEQNPIPLSSSLSLIPVILMSPPPRYAIDP